MLFAWIVAAVLGADNPCTNGSFEDLAPSGFPADWGRVGTKIEVSADAHSGKRALRFVRQAGTDPKTETGLNRLRLLDRLQGGMEFWYKAVSAQEANLRVYAIPINAEGIERTDSPRVAFTVPAGHVGDGQWHRGRIKYDFTKDPKVKSLHFAVRIEGAAGELLIDDFAYLQRVGPVLRFGTVRLDEDPKQPGRRGRVYVPLWNDGDAPARDVRAVLAAPAGLVTQPAELRLGDLAPGKRVLAVWTLEGPRSQPATLSASAASGDVTAMTSLKLAPQLVVRNFGPLAPVAAVGRPVTMECVLANPGSVAVRQPAVVFRMGNEAFTVPADSIAPKTTVTLRAALAPKAQGDVQFGASFRAAGPVEIPAPLQGTILVGAASELPPPSGGLRAAATPEFAILENERLRLAFRRNGFGFGPAEIAVKNPGGWETVAWTGSLGRVRDRAMKDGAEWMNAFAEKPPVAFSEPGKPARLEYEAALRGYVLRVAWELAAGSRQIACRAVLTAGSPHELVDFEGPVVWVLRRDEAVFPGLEWLVGDELSSDSLDIAPGHPDCDRSRPNPQYVTVPAIGVSSPSGTVGLLWDVHQRWGGRLDRPRATFSSPDRLGNFRAHRMSLGVPSGDLAKAHDPSPKPYALAAGKTLRLEFRILADGSSTDPLAAIDEYVRLYGIPRPAPLPRGSYEKEIEFSMQGYLKSLWVEDEKTWWTSKGGGIMSPKGRPPSYIADLLIGEILSPDPAVRRACRERADEVTRLVGIKPRLDAMRFPGRFDHGVAHPTSAAALLASRGDDGSWRFDADLQAGPPFVGMDYYELGPDDAVEVGTCARKAFEVLRYARIAGDGDTCRRAQKTLELMETFRVPRAAQVWEVPVHTPDILAAAEAVDAYLEAYRFSNDPRWLRDAVTWARRGLPFVYLWEDPEKPFLLGGSIPVFGATWYQGSWFARPVQWNGLRYAEALLKLAEHDKSYPWRQIAQLLVHSAIHQQDAAGENAALWPDNISAIDSEKCPWVFAPRMIVQSVLHLLDRDEEPNTVIVGQGQRRLHITSTAKITEAAWDGSTCSFRATFPPGEEGMVLVSNVGRPTKVSIGPPRPRPLSREREGESQSLAEREDLEKGNEPGWRYDVGLGFLSIRIVRDGPSPVRIEGASFRRVDRLPQLAERIAFEFNESAEGWMTAHHVGPLEIRDGSLVGRITGGDPYIVRGLLRVQGDACPTVVLRMRVTGGAMGQFYWGTESSPAYSEEQVVTFPLEADGQFHEYRLDLGRHARWSGQTITALRIDPGNGAARAEFAIDYVRAEGR